MLLYQHVVRGLALASVALLASCSSCGSETGATGEGQLPLQVASGFDFAKDSFSFENFGGDGLGEQITPRIMERMFGAEVVCLPESDPCALTIPARMWMEGTNETLDQGRSEGFALTSLMFFSGQLDPRDFGAETVGGLKLSGNTALQDEIAYWSATQAVPTAEREDVRYEARDVLPFLATALAPDAKKHYRLAIAQKTPAGFQRGHALTPIGYFRDQEDPSLYWLRVYDNNFPQREQLIELRPEDNSWRYEFASVDGAPIVYEGSSETRNYLYFASIESRQGLLPAPFAEGAEFAFQSSSGATIVATNEDGEETGIRDGEVIEAAGDWVSPAFSSCPLCGNAVAIVNQASLRAGVTPKNLITVTSNSSNGPSFSHQNRVTKIQNYSAGGASVVEVKRAEVGDAVTFKDDGGVLFSSNENKGVKVTATMTDEDGVRHTVTVTVDPSADSSGVNVSITKGDDGKPQVKVDGLPPGTAVEIEATAKTYVKDEQTGTWGTQEVTSKVEYTSNGKPAEASVGDGARVNLKTEPADPALCSNGSKDDSETDADCGGSCGATCGFDRVCRNDGDCLSSICEAGRCADNDPGCSSGTRSSGETDIDCGGALCDACQVGSSCKEDSDCEGSECIEGVCQNKYPIYIEYDRKPTDYFTREEIEIDGVVDMHFVSMTEHLRQGGTFPHKFKIGEGYSFRAYPSSLRHCGFDAKLHYAGPTADNPDRAEGVLKMNCAPEQYNRKILSISGGDIAPDWSKLAEVMSNDSITFAVRTDDGPIQLVEIDESFVNVSRFEIMADLGAYASKWSVGTVKQPSSNLYTYTVSPDPTQQTGEIRLAPTSFNRAGLLFTDQYGMKVNTIGWGSPTRFYLESSAGTCADGEHGAGETATDCGGTTCMGCAEDSLCLVDSDCGAGMQCLGYLCVAGTCQNNTRDADESDIDCGGTSACARCDNGQACTQPSDCGADSTCSNNVCVIAQCVNNTKDANETDVDCGGTSGCGPCDDGLACVVPADCQPTSSCTDNICEPATCSNGALDANETGQDCGGMVCSARCGFQRGCAVDSDCESGLSCSGDVCVPTTCVNSVKDANETDIDCGGTSGCGPCDDGGACAMASDCQATSSCVTNRCEPATCANNTLDANETGPDCGGSVCSARCGAQVACLVDSDCDAGLSCPSNVCVIAQCVNNTKDANESDVDCGGTSGCGPCADGDACQGPSDCQPTSSCTDNICEPATCSNGMLDANETGPDCGGSVCSARCGAQVACAIGSDCDAGLACSGNVCLPATCLNNAKDANESDIDCGGASGCGPCSDGQSCVVAGDCSMGSLCAVDVCEPASCVNLMQDGQESDVDCGGSACISRCPVGLACNLVSDCEPGAICQGNVCLPPTCGNSMTDPDEADVDCGGPSSCARCANGSACVFDTDCVSGSKCIDSSCQSALCDNTLMDGSETDVDCGGPDCTSRCGLGQSCAMPSDCEVGLSCENGSCVEATCSNNLQDVDESDTDCGGTSQCPRCNTGQACTLASDCVSNAPCVNNACAPASCANNIQDGTETDIDCGNAECGPCGGGGGMGQSCTLDTDCPDDDCECGVNSGNCFNDSGTCGTGQYFIDQPVTDGTAASGTFTIPAGCDQLFVQAWGAAGGGEDQGGTITTQGGAGGYVDGTIAVTPGDVVTVWLGQGGAPVSTAGAGSYLGTSAPGGAGGSVGASGASPGGGGGLTSVQITGTTPYAFSVPAGGGGAQFGGSGQTVMSVGGGGAAGYAGQSGGVDQAGGGAGDSGGVPDTAGSYGTLPSGLQGYDGDTFTYFPGGQTNNDYGRCFGANMLSAGASDPAIGIGGDGCVILRCVGQ